MSFGGNLQYLRRLHRGMTQEELAEKLDVSRQSVSKWENDGVYPDMGTLLRVCELFSCTLDELVRGDMNPKNEAYGEPEIVRVEGFSYLPYTVISCDPESDAIRRARDMAVKYGVETPRIIGWDFPHLSQEQINVYHMHGYTAALVLPQGLQTEGEVKSQAAHDYARITICDSMGDPFVTIPNAYRVLMHFIQVNGFSWQNRDCLDCFEYEYEKDGVSAMDIYIAVN